MEERIELFVFEDSYTQLGMVDCDSWQGELVHAIAHYMEWRFITDEWTNQ